LVDASQILFHSPSMSTSIFKILQPLCNHFATTLQPLCNHFATTILLQQPSSLFWKFNKFSLLLFFDLPLIYSTKILKILSNCLEKNNPIFFAFHKLFLLNADRYISYTFFFNKEKVKFSSFWRTKWFISLLYCCPFSLPLSCPKIW
jgi:hypothetical protein